MPPLFTSTTVGTLLRKALTAARHIHPVGVPRPSPPPLLIGSKLSPIERARLVARRFVQHAQKTFPSLNTPAHRLGYALEPIRIPVQAGARRGLPSRSGGVQSRLYSTTRATFQSAYRLPSHARGPRVSSNVGLGSARAYSGGAGAGGAQTMLQNIPLGFRALYEGLKDEDLEGRWPAPTKRYMPYCPAESRHRTRKLRRTRRLARVHSVACSVDSARSGSFFADRAHYFPLPGRRSETEAPALLVPEKLVTPGTTTTLVLPVAATLQAILQPTTHIPYADAELGVAVFAELFAGVGEVALASDTVLGCVLPVLAKLRSLGVLQEHGSERTQEGPLVVGSVTRDILGEPQTIVFDFHDRSESDVRTILGETLKKNVLDQEWWFIQERESSTAQQAASPTPDAIDAEVNVWADEDAASSCCSTRDVEVIMPTMSLDLATVADLSSSWDARSVREDSMIATPLSALGSELYFDGSVGSVLSDLSPLSSHSDSDGDGDGRLAGQFSPGDLRERLALWAQYDGDVSDDGSSLSGWSSSGPSETDEAVELAVEPVTASYLSPSSAPRQGAGIAGFYHGLMLGNYW